MATGMSGDEMKRLVRRYYEEVFDQRRLDVLDEVFAPDFIGHSGVVGAYTLDDVRRTVTLEQAETTEDQTVIEDQIAEGDRVVTRWTYRFQHATSFFGELPTSRRLTMDGVQIDRIVNGKIAERWEIKDTFGLIQSLGGEVSFPGAKPLASPPER